MDFSKETIQASEASDLAYAKWYEALPEEKKAQFFSSGFDFVANKIRHDVTTENPFATEADIKMRFIELTQKQDYPTDTFDFIEKTMQKYSDKEWKQRFSAIQQSLGWSYADIARFIGAASGDAIKASLNRKVPAFAKLAVCVFEAMEEKKQE